ncbi:protein PHLOEM PROTEIN 2-LIKE A10-like [Alnus glutinosa]|uniref:protein PHLOEM PROTEIN 2-LIKE A10-like n=1 Tax=Alnus glutinosa TaxID=3517 RepID=UPI002D781498|nr:protein PHLOEM PROTEIN 2-LIKE A10-like [Alnus glutinosa]
MMDLQLVKTGFDFASKRRKKLVLLLSAFGFTGYSLYTVYHLPSVAHKRERISKLLSALVSVAEAASASAESIGVVSEDLKQFLQSDSDRVPNSLKQISKIASSEEFSQSLTRLTQALTVGILRGYGSAGGSVGGGDIGANSSSFADHAMDKLFSTAGSGFASAVVGSFARNLVMAFCSNNSTNFEHFDSETNRIPQWVNVVCGDKCRELIGDCIQLFVSTAVAVYLDKTMNINFYDDLLSGLTNPKHEMKARDMLVSVCNGAVETLVKTCHDSGMISSPGPPSSATGKGSTPARIEDMILKPSEEKDRGWVGRVSSTLAVPSNRRFVLDVTGRVTFETVRSFLELLLEKLYEGLKRCVQIVHDAVVDGGVEAVRYATAKSSVVATICLSLCLHILEGPWILVPA